MNTANPTTTQTSEADLKTRSRASHDMLSRVAMSIYWMSRYVERAENTARFIDVNLQLGLDMPQSSAQWYPLVVTTGDADSFADRYNAATKQNVIDFLTFDRDNPNSIISCLTAARENARQIREVISSEMWQHLNRFYLMVRDTGFRQQIGRREHMFYEDIQAAGQSFIGITDTTMAHNVGWHFSRLGREIERADKTSRILDVKYYILLPKVEDVGTPVDSIQWAALLKSASALEMYRQVHGRITPDHVVEFLILDREFPRAVLYCLTRAQESLHAITTSPTNTFSNLSEQRLGQLWSQLAYGRAEDIVAGGLHEFIDNLQVRLNSIGHAVHEDFFALRPLQPANLRNTRFVQ